MSSSHLLAMRTLFDPHAAGDLSASYELRLGEARFYARVADGRLEAGRGAADQPDAIIETDSGTLAALLWEGRELAEALRSGEVEVVGDTELASRLLRLFPFPEAVAAAAGA